MGVETLNLTRALKGSAQMQGAWGEMILETLLEKSGLREGEEYRRQTSHTKDDGGRLRTDVIVNLPSGQHVVIDSKVAMVAFEAYVNAESDEERAVSLSAHVAAMRAHIKGLGSKEYHSATGGGLDYVIMFVPIEGALAAALQRDPTLTSYAAQNNVAIGTPTTLMIALRTIENVWKVERRNQNAEAIADRAGHLYSKFVGFIEDMQALGNRLGQAQGSYSAAMGKLQTGAGNLVGQAEKLKELGAKTTRSLPRGLVVDDGVADAPAGLIMGGFDPPPSVATGPQAEESVRGLDQA
jgi:DNA recombination protein RmuC